ncbi:MAG: hypothetical protein JNM62_03760 [Flavobacteriales bacterium]|nr:hypothetical protein [Flavobacteriales bacterium]
MNGIRTYKRAALPLVGAVLLGAGLLAGCSKEGAVATPRTARTLDPAVQQRIREQVQQLPGVGIYNRTMNKVIVFKSLPDGSRSFNFVDPPTGGIDFASSNGGQWTWSETQGLMILTEPSSGTGGGGGTVVAGDASLDIELAVCFSFDEEGLGMDLFDTGINDVAGVIGIAGDFDALINGDFSSGEEDLFDYFHGFAYYLVYAEQLGNNSYEVLNWIDDLDQDEEDLENFGFSFVVSFQNEGGIYLSQDGELQVSGGSIGFNGNYYALEGVGFFEEDEEGDGSASTVPGFGTMGCDQ